MKFPNWSLVYANNSHNEAYDKQANEITEPTLSAILDEDCIEIIKR